MSVLIPSILPLGNHITQLQAQWSSTEDCLYRRPGGRHHAAGSLKDVSGLSSAHPATQAGEDWLCYGLWAWVSSFYLFSHRSYSLITEIVLYS